MKKWFTTLFMALAMMLSNVASFAQSTSESEMPEFIANLVYETDLNNSFDVLCGIYKFKPAETIELDTVYVSTMMKANGGGVFRKDLFQFINYMDFGYGMPSQSAIYECYFDAEGKVHWDRPELRYGYSVPEEMAALNGMLVEDPASGELYGIYEANYGYGSMLARADLDNLTREDIGELENYYLCIACNYEGRLFGLTEDGLLYEINKQSGEETEIGDTGVWPEYVDQSMCFDSATGHLWWATTEDGEAKLYEIDPTTAAATLRGTFPWQERFFALTIAKKPTPLVAPSAVTNIDADFAKGSTTGTLSFTLPSTSIDGNALSGNLTYHVYANGEEVATNTAPVGSVASEQLTLSSGNTRFRIYAENEAGQGEDATLTLWIGFDIPAAPTNVLLDMNANREATVTWDTVTESLNGGYFDRDKVQYKVTYFADGESTEMYTTETTLDIDLNYIEERKPCHVGVQAVNGDAESAETISNNVATGSPLEVPFRDDFEGEHMASLYTLLDANGDGNTWQWTGEQFGTFVYKYNKGYDADDWFVTPLFNLEAGKNYLLSFEARPMGKEYPEMISAFIGSGMDMSVYTALLNETEIDSSHEFSLPFTPAESGAYRMAIHVTSPFTQLNLVLNYIAVDLNDQSVVKEVCQEDLQPSQLYGIDGRRIDNSRGKHGIYIIRQGSQTIKITR